MADLIAKGNYQGKGYGTPEPGISPEKKSKFVRVAIQIEGGEFNGRIVNRDFYFTEKARDRSIDALETLGCTFPGNDINDYTGFGSTTVNFTVEHESYEKDGETKTVAKIGFVNRNAGINPEARMDEAAKAAFKAEMLGTLASRKGKAQATSNGPAASKAPF
jgi:hypothetical protein